MKHPPRFILFLALLTATAGMSSLPPPVRAQDSTDAKIRLLPQALSARDAGDLNTGTVSRPEAPKELPNRQATRAQLLNEVEHAWQRPAIFRERAPEAARAAAVEPVFRKLNEIVLPHVHWTRAPLSEVVAALGAISEQFDSSGDPQKGVNMVLLDPANKNPAVTITLRNAPLRRVLDFVTESVGYQYEVQTDAVVVRPGGETPPCCA
jgi:hypothetical protein